MKQNIENEKLADKSPEEAKQAVKNKVAKGVASAAGALEGFVEQARENDLPETSKQAVRKAGETTREVTKATKEQGKKVKDAIKGEPDRPEFGRR